MHRVAPGPETLRFEGPGATITVQFGENPEFADRAA